MKNTHRRLLALLLCVLMATSVAMTACTPVEENPTTDPTTTAPTTQPPTEGPGASAVLTFVLKTSAGMPVAGAKLILTNKYPLVDDYEPEVAVTDAEGVAVIRLNDVDPAYPTTPYSLMVEDLPEFHLTGIQPAYEIAPGEERTINIEVLDNTPDGTLEHAYFVASEPVSKTFEPGQTIYFQAFGGEGRKVILEDANVELAMLGKSYQPDADGRIIAYVEGVEADDHVSFAVTNTGSETREIFVYMDSDPGTSDNPYTIAPGSQSVTATVPGGRVVYFRWVATEAGSVTAGPVDTAVGSVSLVRNRTEIDENGKEVTTPTASAYTNAEDSQVSMDFEAGDVILVRVTCNDAAGGEVEFVFDWTSDESAN